METDREKVLNALCALDHRLISNEGELLEIARLYNVKAAMWELGRKPAPGLKPGKVYAALRKHAVARARRDQVGVTPKELCRIIDEVITGDLHMLGIVRGKQMPKRYVKQKTSKNRY